jgi:Transposase C of IS166 homeodomain
LLRQKMHLLTRRVFGRSSEKLDADQFDLFLLAPENEQIPRQGVVTRLECT